MYFEGKNTIEGVGSMILMKENWVPQDGKRFGLSLAFFSGGGQSKERIGALARTIWEPFKGDSGMKGRFSRPLSRIWDN